MVYLIQQIEFILHNLYTIEIDWKNRNYYNCGEFGYITRYCRNRETKNRIGERKKLEYRENKNNEKKRIIKGRNNQNNNLNRDKDLIVLN